MPRRIVIHEEDYPRIMEMEERNAGVILQNLIRTLNGDEVYITGDAYIDYFSEVTCQKMMRFVELSERQAANGRKGGAPVGNNNATSEKQPKNNPKTSQKQPKTNPNTNTNTNTNTYKDKKTFGECANVFLSDEEFEKIKSKGLENLIDELSLYIEASGKKYKSHYAVIRQWDNRRKKEKAESVVSSSGREAKNQFNRYLQRTDYDFAALEKKLTRN